MNRSGIRLYAAAIAILLWTAAPASAQFSPRPLGGDVTVGETYRVEGFMGLWSPGATMTISSESLGIPGNLIDFKEDLGLQDQRFGDFGIVLRAAKKHKFRFQAIPINYDNGPINITHDIVFNGQRYRANIPVTSTLSWKTYRFGYEYDFISRSRGFGGLVLEAKYTDVTATLATPVFTEFAHARAPIPAIGGIVRFYVVPNIAITGEVTGLKFPASVIEDFEAHYADIDIYGTLNFTPNVGAQIGWKSLDVGYLLERDTGSFVLRGLYFGVVARY
jgi:hypothetical protein